MYEDAQGDPEEQDKDAETLRVKTESISAIRFSQNSRFCDIWRFIN